MLIYYLPSQLFHFEYKCLQNKKIEKSTIVSQKLKNMGIVFLSLIESSFFVALVSNPKK